MPSIFYLINTTGVCVGGGEKILPRSRADTSPLCQRNCKHAVRNFATDLGVGGHMLPQISMFASTQIGQCRGGQRYGREKVDQCRDLVEEDGGRLGLGG